MERLALYYPTSPVHINQPFAVNPEYYKKLGVEGHNGIDFYAPDGWIIRAAHDGVVTFTGEDAAGGLGVVIRTHQKYQWEHGQDFFKSIYWHIKKGMFFVKPGDKVEIGQIIALADNTGLSTGSHLHFGLKPIAQGEAEWIWYNTQQDNSFKGAIDPMPYFQLETAEEARKKLDYIGVQIDKIRAALAIYLAKK